MWRMTAYTHTPIPTDIYDSETVTSMQQWVAFSNRMSQRHSMRCRNHNSWVRTTKVQWIAPTLNTDFIRNVYTDIQCTVCGPVDEHNLYTSWQAGTVSYPNYSHPQLSGRIWRKSVISAPRLHYYIVPGIPPVLWWLRSCQRLSLKLVIIEQIAGTTPFPVPPQVYNVIAG